MELDEINLLITCIYISYIAVVLYFRSLLWFLFLEQLRIRVLGFYFCDSWYVPRNEYKVFSY